MGRLTFCVLYEKKYTASKKNTSPLVVVVVTDMSYAGGQSGVHSENSEQWGFFEDLIALDVPYFASFGSFVFWLMIVYMSNFSGGK